MDAGTAYSTAGGEMDDTLTYGEWLNGRAALLLDWLFAHVFTLGAMTQALIIVAALLAAHVFARRSAAWLKRKLKKPRRKSLIRLHATYREMFFLAYGMLFLWTAVITMEAAELPLRILWIAASLATAWAVIRFTSSTIESRFWSRVIAVTLWVLAALNIMGWLGPLLGVMDKAALTVGEYRLSLLMMVKSLLALALLLWAIGLASTLLQRSFAKTSGLTPSQRVLFYKLSSIALYTVAGLIGLNILGLDLTAFTVFGGALGLGIGFGLQKVFSNLISGIILLLDKSVKPGDVIAIGNTFGWVNSLGARCVSVLTRDGKEHLIPNENLITQEVENWSYSDQNVRVHIPVRVSYSSDIHRVRDLLLQAAGEHPRTLKELPPTCLIASFGESSVEFELRVWIDDPAEGVSNIKSDIYFRIWDLFKENGVEIPFPQRDIHIKPEGVEQLASVLSNGNQTT